MERLIECVPNFSEGRNSEIIKKITDEIESVKGIKLLDVDPGFDMNRTVVTFIGSPENVEIASFLAIKKASELIDMSKHKGSHPRMGATDVCPFIPVSGVEIEEAIELSKRVAKRVAEELNIPVYLYEKSAQKAERVNLAVIRKGEYEGLEAKLKDENWLPDFGKAEFNKKSGATVIGVREFLIAYNISLNTREKNYATDIAFELREKGRSARRPVSKPYYHKGGKILKYSLGNYPCGSCDFVGKSIEETIEHCKKEHNYDLVELLKLNSINPFSPEGESVKKPGLFRNVKAIGWMVDKYDRAQISINLTDFNVTSMHDVLEATRILASERGLVVTGSEIVGMVPFKALYETGKYYLRKQGKSTGIPITDIIETAVQSLGLRDVSDFVIEERVLGLPKYDKSALVSKTIINFMDEVSRESPAPGGGSIAALAGSLGASLISMVSNLTTYKAGTENIDIILTEVAEKAQVLKDSLLIAVDDDTNAFNSFMEAKRLPQQTDDEKQVREIAMQQGLKEAVLVPLNTAELSLEILKLSGIVAKFGNKNSITDVGVGAQIAKTGVIGGIYNVLINLKDIKDQDFKATMRAKCETLKSESEKLTTEIDELVLSKME